MLKTRPAAQRDSQLLEDRASRTLLKCCGDKCSTLCLGGTGPLCRPGHDWLGSSSAETHGRPRRGLNAVSANPGSSERTDM